MRRLARMMEQLSLKLVRSLVTGAPLNSGSFRAGS